MVTKAMSRSDVGRKLMGAVRNFANERQISRIQLSVLAGSENVMAFYCAMGFDTVILYMEQDLSSNINE
ncbi:hypothetical protein AM10699_67590 (plasmid) [Acaryochloris marina MBIC10699]|nr:hypothetical protein AM10699_67590 [Acaryochloris marina MBIC10699]